MSVIGGSVVGFRSVALFETSLWIAAVVANGGTVSTARTRLVNDLIFGLQADGIWSKLDRLWLLAAENQPSALTDLVALSLATAVNSPTFTADQGYAGEDASLPTKYINTNYNPTGNAVNFALGGAHISAWSLTNTATVNVAGALLGVHNTVPPGSQSNIYVTFNDGNVYGRVLDNPTSGSQGAPGTRIGHWLINRSGGSTTQLYQNGSSFSNPNGAVAAGLPDNDLYILATNNSIPDSGTPNQIALASVGGHLTSTEVAKFYSRLRTYLTAIGVP